ncbi:phosphotransferase family protein [Sphingobium scionense]
MLKLFHEGVDAGIIAREHAMAQAIQETGLPVPCVFGSAEAGGRQGIIYSEIEGPNLLHHIVRHPHRIGWAMGAMAALQRAIHTHDLPELRSRKAILAEDIEMAPIGDRLRAAAIDRLDQLIEGDRLSHGDLHPANLIVSGDGLAVIDWSKAARSAPAADVVRSEMLMRFGPGQSVGWRAGCAMPPPLIMLHAIASWRGWSPRRSMPGGRWWDWAGCGIGCRGATRPLPPIWPRRCAAPDCRRRTPEIGADVVGGWRWVVRPRPMPPGGCWAPVIEASSRAHALSLF